MKDGEEQEEGDEEMELQDDSDGMKIRGIEGRR